jgi:hypothetical protein
MTTAMGRALAVASLLVLVGCDQDWPGAYPDVWVDATPDVLPDPGYDPGVDPAEDAGPDISVDVPEEEAPAPCTYPTGPYAFRNVGDTVAPMAWPSAVPGSSETSTAADLEDYFCDPDVNSVFVLVTNTT